MVAQSCPSIAVWSRLCLIQTSSGMRLYLVPLHLPRLSARRRSLHVIVFEVMSPAPSSLPGPSPRIHPMPAGSRKLRSVRPLDGLRPVFMPIASAADGESFQNLRGVVGDGIPTLVMTHVRLHPISRPTKCCACSKCCP